LAIQLDALLGLDDGRGLIEEGVDLRVLVPGRVRVALAAVEQDVGEPVRIDPGCPPGRPREPHGALELLWIELSLRDELDLDTEAERGELRLEELAELRIGRLHEERQRNGIVEIPRFLQLRRRQSGIVLHPCILGIRPPSFEEELAGWNPEAVV